MLLTIVTIVCYTAVALVVLCCISCIQLTRSVLIATVKDVCWEIIYFVLSYYHSKNSSNYSIDHCKKKVIENFLRLVQNRNCGT